MSLPPAALALRLELATLLASAPESVRNAWFDDDLGALFAGADVALQKAEWCEAWAQRFGLTERERKCFKEAAAILRRAIPMLPEHAPPEVSEIRHVDEDYNESVRQADRRYARRRRRTA